MFFKYFRNFLLEKLNFKNKNVEKNINPSLNSLYFYVQPLKLLSNS